MRLRVDFKVEYAELETRAVLVGNPAQVEAVTNLVLVPRLPGTYAYTPDGKLALRTWARGVSTSYAYDGAGNLVSTAYSDGTPSISCAYDRSGNIVSAVTDGVATNLYAYSVEGLVTNEGKHKGQSLLT